MTARHAGPLLRPSLLVPILALLALLLMPEAALAQPLSGGGASVTVSPASGPVGARLTVTGEHFVRGDPVKVGYTTADCSTMTTIAGATGTVKTDGSLSIGLTWPMTGQGSFTVCVQDTTTGKTYPSQNAYSVLSTAAPALTISPSPVGSQGQVTVSGANFLPAGGSIEVLWGPQAGGGAAVGDLCANSVWSKTSDANGKFSFSFKAPYTGSNLPITIIAVSPAGSCGHQPILSAQQNLTVQAGAVATATASSSAKPNNPIVAPTWPPTGIWSVVYCLIGLLLFLLLLLALLVASRSRNKNQPAVVNQGSQAGRGAGGGQGNRLMGSTRVSVGSDGRPTASEQMYTQNRRGTATQVADMGSEDMPPLQGSSGSGRSSRY